MKELKQENQKLKELLAESNALLKVCKTQVGTIIGEQIDEVTSKIDGRKFDKTAWDLRDRNGEQ